MATNSIKTISHDRNPPNLSGRVFLRALKAYETALAEIAGETNQTNVYNPRQPREDAELLCVLLIKYDEGLEEVMFSDYEEARTIQAWLKSQGIDSGFIG
jgi:hypothetical protein